MNRPETEKLCVAQLPPDHLSGGEPVFEEPWQAQAFAMAVSLIESGQISWQEWSTALGDEISQAAQQGIAEDGSGYYELWLNTLERLVDGHGLASTNDLATLEQAWRHAYASTPHGEPVTLPD